MESILALRAKLQCRHPVNSSTSLNLSRQDISLSLQRRTIGLVQSISQTIKKTWERDRLSKTGFQILFCTKGGGSMSKSPHCLECRVRLQTQRIEMRVSGIGHQLRVWGCGASSTESATKFMCCLDFGGEELGIGDHTGGESNESWRLGVDNSFDKTINQCHHQPTVSYLWALLLAKLASSYCTSYRSHPRKPLGTGRCVDRLQ